MSETRLDYVKWEQYLGVCDDEGTKASTSGYVVWLSEQDEEERDDVAFSA